MYKIARGASVSEIEVPCRCWWEVREPHEREDHGDSERQSQGMGWEQRRSEWGCVKNPLQEAQREVEGAIARGVCGAKEFLKKKFKNVQQNVKLYCHDVISIISHCKQLVIGAYLSRHFLCICRYPLCLQTISSILHASNFILHCGYFNVSIPNSVTIA